MPQPNSTTKTVIDAQLAFTLILIEVPLELLFFWVTNRVFGESARETRKLTEALTQAMQTTQDRERRIKQEEERSHNLREHFSSLIQKIEGANETLLLTDWTRHLPRSRFNISLLQHIYTANKPLFVAMNETTVYDAKCSDRSIWKEVTDKIKQEITAAGHSLSSGDELMRFASEVSGEIEQKAGKGDWQDIQAQYQQDKENYAVTTRLMKTSAVYEIKTNADRLASFINNLASDRSLLDRLTVHRENCKKAKDLKADSKTGLERVFNSTSTKGVDFGGCCDDCLQFYPLEEQTKFRAELKLLQDIEIFKKWTAPAS